MGVICRGGGKRCTGFKILLRYNTLFYVNDSLGRVFLQNVCDYQEFCLMFGK